MSGEIIRVQQTDAPLSSRFKISCTGSGICAELAPDLICLDDRRGICRLLVGKTVMIEGVEFSEGAIPEGLFDQAIAAQEICDSEAVYIVDPTAIT